MSEKWALVRGYEPDYAISDLGRVRSMKTNRILRPGMSPDFYSIVVLSKRGVPKTHKIHRLVLEQFSYRPKGTIANHMNGIKTDNRLINLEWCTPSENIAHAWRTGLMTYSYPNKSVCKKGHRWIERNIYVSPKGKRDCAVCRWQRNNKEITYG